MPGNLTTRDFLGVLLPTFGSVTVTFAQGGGYSQTVTCIYRKIFNVVTLLVPSFSANATAADLLNTGIGSLPAIITPNQNSSFLVAGRDGGATTTPVLIQVSVDGQLKLYRTPAFNNFVIGNFSGLNGNAQITYMLD